MKTYKEFLEESFLLEGKQITIYHGDNFGTTKLSPKLMNNGNNQEGIGIYFSDKIETANAYGKDVVSLDIDMSKFVNAREPTHKYINSRKLTQMLKELHDTDDEAFFYFASDYIELAEVEDVVEGHFSEMASNIKNEQVRNLQVALAQAFGVEPFVKVWNNVLGNDIHGTYSKNNSRENWFSVINDKLKVQKV